METPAESLESIRSFLGVTNSNSVNPDSEQLLRHILQSLETKVDRIVSDHAHLDDEYPDEFTKHNAEQELREIEAQNASLSNQVQDLTHLYLQATCKLQHNYHTLLHSLHSKEPEQPKASHQIHNFKTPQFFEMMDLKRKIETNETTLKSLQHLDLKLKMFEAVEEIEEALTGLKVIDFEENCIRVSLKTYIPYFEDLLCQLNAENIDKLSEVKHELLIEVMDGTMELKNVEIFPNDVYVGDIIEAANTFRKFSVLSTPGAWSSLGWFLQKVQDRIIICTIRRFVVKNANGSRHSIEYLDKDELIVAHMIGGIDAFIKPSESWPLSASALKLVSVKSSDPNVKEVSLSLLCKVEEVANSLEFKVRKSITNFVDGIEDILVEKMRPELRSNNILQ